MPQRSLSDISKCEIIFLGFFVKGPDMSEDAPSSKISKDVQILPEVTDNNR